MALIQDKSGKEAAAYGELLFKMSFCHDVSIEAWWLVLLHLVMNSIFLLWMLAPLVKMIILGPVRLEYLMARKPEQWEVLEYWGHRCLVAAPEVRTLRMRPRWPLTLCERPEF